jgi:hypothetical protein
MGKSRSYEIIEYRKKILQEICKSEELVKLLGCENEEYPEDILPYKWVFPHEFIPETITKTERYVNFEVSATLDPKNNTYKDLTIYFFVLCHEDVIRYKGTLWYDRVVCELDDIFCETNVLGVGKTYLMSNVPYSPQNKFKGRLLKFSVKDFNNGLKNGK